MTISRWHDGQTPACPDCGNLTAKDDDGENAYMFRCEHCRSAPFKSMAYILHAPIGSLNWRCHEFVYEEKAKR